MVSDIVKCIPLYVINLTENLFWWLHQRAKRVNELRSFQKWLEVEAHKILKTVDTRWLSVESCVNHILEQNTPFSFTLIPWRTKGSLMRNLGRR